MSALPTQALAPFAAVIVAAGKGLRAGLPLPKQFARWRGKPVLRHSAETLAQAGAAPIVVAIPPGADELAAECLHGLPGVLLVTGGVLSVLALAACSSSGSDTSSSPAATSAQAASPAAGSGGGDSAFAAYRDCLAQNGVTLPEGGFGGGQGGGTPPSGMPTGAPPSGMTPPSGMPSGGPDGGPGMQLPDGVDQATWDAAQQACASLRPQGGPGSGQGGGQGQPPASSQAQPTTEAG